MPPGFNVVEVEDRCFRVTALGWAGILLSVLFGVRLGWLPTGGWIDRWTAGVTSDETAAFPASRCNRATMSCGSPVTATTV